MLVSGRIILHFFREDNHLSNRPVWPFTKAREAAANGRWGMVLKGETTEIAPWFLTLQLSFQLDFFYKRTMWVYIQQSFFFEP